MARIDTLPPEQRIAWRQSRLDCRCRACGATSAASSRCYWCGGRDLEYRVHVPKGQTQWCQQVSGAAVYVPANPRRGPVERPQPPLSDPLPLDADTDATVGGLWGSTTP